MPQQALRTSPSAEALFELARLHMHRGERPQAIAAYENAIALAPNSPKLHISLAEAFFQSGNLAEAANHYRAAVDLDPENPQNHFALGVVLHELGETIPASRAYAKALTLKPDFAFALNNLGTLLLDRNLLNRAEALIRRSLTINPKNPAALCNLAKVFTKQGDLPTALKLLHAALTLDPHRTNTLCSLGALLEMLGNLDHAVLCYQRALELQPSCAPARFYLSTTQLANGDLAIGWLGYETRWLTQEFRNARPHLPQPQWRGEDLRGARILIYAEQGLGDTLQFARYLPMLVAMGATVVLKTQSPLLRLLTTSFPNIRIVASSLDEFVHFEWQSALMSLPSAFETTLANIPAPIPYLKPDPIAAKLWSNRLNTPDLRIGLVWSGNPRHARDLQRSIPLDQLAPLTQLKGATFYSLQLGDTARQKSTSTSSIRLTDLADHLQDFSDTAAILANLDLVITVDTAIAHAAGALGKPVWMLVSHAPDWRWLKDRSDSPWYPTMRIFRQRQRDDWTQVLAQIEAELRTILRTRSS